MNSSPVRKSRSQVTNYETEHLQVHFTDSFSQSTGISVLFRDSESESSLKDTSHWTVLMTKEQTGLDGSGSLQPGPVLHGGRKNTNRIQFGVDPLSVETEYVDLNAKSAEPQMDVKAPERPKIQLVTSEIEEDEFDEGPPRTEDPSQS